MAGNGGVRECAVDGTPRTTRDSLVDLKGDAKQLPQIPFVLFRKDADCLATAYGTAASLFSALVESSEKSFLLLVRQGGLAVCLCCRSQRLCETRGAPQTHPHKQ